MATGFKIQHAGPYEPGRHFVCIKLVGIRAALGMSNLLYLDPKEIDYARSCLTEGYIVSFGPHAFKGFGGYTGPESAGYKVGDYVVFRRSMGQWYPPLAGEDFTEGSGYRLVEDETIMCKIENPHQNLREIINSGK